MHAFELGLEAGETMRRLSDLGDLAVQDDSGENVTSQAEGPQATLENFVTTFKQIERIAHEQCGLVCAEIIRRNNRSAS